jgi:hypothetical protein
VLANGTANSNNTLLTTHEHNRRTTMADPINFPGTVEWSGENPAISLKETSDGPFVALASFFRVVMSPHGRGNALLLLQSPQEANPPADGANILFSDNEPLARYLVKEFVSYFGAFKGLPSLANLPHRKLDSAVAEGDPASTYSEVVTSGDMVVRLTWSGLNNAFCFALPPDKSATGKHHMPSLFVPCADATITMNGRKLPGKPVPRELAGHKFTTAMLAFSETWVRV